MNEKIIEHKCDRMVSGLFSIFKYKISKPVNGWLIQCKLINYAFPVHYCAFCGIELGKSNSEEGSRKQIRIGCAVILKKEDKILLGRRNKDPNKGKMILAGGGVKPFESLNGTLRREILEEVNLEITNIKFFNIYEIINPPDEHRIIIYWTADYLSGEVRSGSDLLDAKFFTKQDILELIKQKEVTTTVSMVLNDYFLSENRKEEK